MRIGVIADVHGNTTALDAVIDHAATGAEIDQWWVLGDIVAFGPDPVGVIDRVLKLPDVQLLTGNTERYVLQHERPFPSFDDVRQDPALLERLVEVAESIAWTRGILTQADRMGWLATLPTTMRFTLGGNVRVLAVHASPDADDGPGIDPDIADADLAALLDGCDANVVIGGHTHQVTDRMVGHIRALNPGSIANARRLDRCATYMVLHADDTNFDVQTHVVDYDHAVEIEAIDRVRHPAAGYLRRFHDVALA